jgi:ankyrin repeat protein
LTQNYLQSHACATGHLHIAQHILQNHAESIDLNTRNNHGEIALMLACCYDHLPVVQYMLQHHAGSIDINARNNQGLTAIEIAIRQSYMIIVGLLDSYEGLSRVLSRSIS